MTEHTYNVKIDKETIAYSMTIENALILVKALTETYYREPDLEIKIIRNNNKAVKEDLSDTREIEIPDDMLP